MSLYGQNLLIQILEWQEKWKVVSFKASSVRAEITHTHTQKMQDSWTWSLLTNKSMNTPNEGLGILHRYSGIPQKKRCSEAKAGIWKSPRHTRSHRDTHTHSLYYEGRSHLSLRLWLNLIVCVCVCGGKIELGSTWAVTPHTFSLLSNTHTHTHTSSWQENLPCGAGWHPRAHLSKLASRPWAWSARQAWWCWSRGLTRGPGAGMQLTSAPSSRLCENSFPPQLSHSCLFNSVLIECV